MKVMAHVDGREIMVQIVRRNGKTYIRRAAVESWNNPTPAQEEVRRTLALGAMSAYSEDNPSRERVVEYVKDSFAETPVTKVKKPHLNSIEEMLAKEYPEQIIEILRS